MLECITWEQFLEWQTYYELEPFGEERADLRSAQVVQALWNIARDVKRHPDGWPLTDFVLNFGDSPRREVVQTIETQTLHIEAWIAGHNAVLAAAQRG